MNIPLNTQPRRFLGMALRKDRSVIAVRSAYRMSCSIGRRGQLGWEHEAGISDFKQIEKEWLLYRRSKRHLN